MSGIKPGIQPLSPSYLHLAYAILTAKNSAFAVTGATLEQRISFDGTPTYLFNLADARTLLLPPAALLPQGEVQIPAGCVSLVDTLRRIKPVLGQLSIKRIVVPVAEPVGGLVKRFTRTGGHWVTLVIDFSTDFELSEHHATVTIADSKVAPYTGTKESTEFSKDIADALQGYLVSIKPRLYLNHQAGRDDVSCGYFTLRCIQELLSAAPHIFKLPQSSEAPLVTSDASWLTAAHAASTLKFIESIVARADKYAAEQAAVVTTPEADLVDDFDVVASGSPKDFFVELLENGVPEWDDKPQATYTSRPNPYDANTTIAPSEATSNTSSNSDVTATSPETRSPSPAAGVTPVTTPEPDAVPAKQPAPEMPTLWQRFINACSRWINWLRSIFCCAPNTAYAANATETPNIDTEAGIKEPEQQIGYCSLRRCVTLYFSRSRVDPASASAAPQNLSNTQKRLNFN